MTNQQHREAVNKRDKAYSLILFVATGTFAATAAYFYGKTYIELIAISVMAFLGAGIIIFLLADAANRASQTKEQGKNQGNERENEKNAEADLERYYRNVGDEGGYSRLFFLAYMITLPIVCVIPLLPETGWPFLVIFIILGLTGDRLTGIFAATVFLLIAVMLTAVPTILLFFSYFLAGIVGVVLFSHLDEAFRVAWPLLISVTINFVVSAANLVMVNEGQLDFETLFIMGANLLVCVLLLLVFLRFYSANVIHKSRIKYMEINDPEFPILVELKQKSLAGYYQAVHTAYLSDKMAKRLGLDDMATKTCGYYHKIGTLRGTNSWEAIEEICREYKFPPAAISLLKEYTDRESTIMSKEAAVVLFADTLVASILYIFSKNPRATPDYNQIIEAIYERKVNSEILDKSLLTVGEMKEIREMLKEEHLYYDFLR
ncbi:MAG: hypothetical protein LBC96_00155 [Lachnospiraceae bacterium]|nr:hypothetical protein [Lachnospiraceae bacterium]